MTELLIKELPHRHDVTTQDLVRIRLGHDFEPFGLAVEDWDDVWSIHLVTVPGYWWSTTGWRPRKPNSTGMVFSGHTLDDCICKANDFIKWWIKQSN
jgi:hypothetical protein